MRTPSPARKPTPMPTACNASFVPVTAAHCSCAVLYCFSCLSRVSSQKAPFSASVGGASLSVTVPKTVPSASSGTTFTPDTVT